MAGPPRIIFKDSISSLPMPTIVFRNKDDTLTDAAALIRSAAFSIALPTPQTLYSSVRKTEGLAPGSVPELSFSQLATSSSDHTPEQAQALAEEQARTAIPRQITVSLGRTLPQPPQEEAYRESPTEAAPDMYGQAASAAAHAASMQQHTVLQQDQQQYAAQMYGMLQHQQHGASDQHPPHLQLQGQPDPLTAHQYASAQLQHSTEPDAGQGLLDASTIVSLLTRHCCCSCLSGLPDNNKCA